MKTDVLFSNITTFLSQFASADFYSKILGTAIAIGLVLIVFGIANRIVSKMAAAALPQPRAFVIKKIIRYAGYVVAIMTLFNALGIDLSALLGAAGIAGIAVGFAAQTSVSNVISGLFLVSEKHFQIGDVIQVGDVSGVVQSIDLLSIKIQTFDNRYIRIPNETLIKTNVINITRFPIRRLDVWVSVAYTSDLERVRTILLDVAGKNPYVLDNPEPLIVFDKFDSSGINILVGLWFEKSEYLNLKNSIMVDIHRRFAEEGIEIPYPKLDVFMRETMV
ncbi:mechanosensitive ion channel family protein [Gracilinema caldarium]|uniref:MscS Mechanosensitive ion channel n=1 Tax=Gracilinema caldarium (strain ATCC 51460 / DSM 7334 / H1) TaxID=744872 RepID=F8EYP3_GRAC1|nr:mechanosensitive ion channel family protein [Gracilinema caldarium]AEJ18620.1 MscS Mechanosensitive ion channel [Gracilinema caldarium DSM 7334]